MTRRLVDYRKLDNTLAKLLIDSYPYGYGDEDIIVFKNVTGEIIEAVEIRTEDTLYLVKISKSLSNFIANFEENIEKELEVKPESISEEEVVPEMENEMELDFEDDDY
jgi:hypothetical protein